ncbi:hypothetical protein [Micromonospora echinospora]|uniref:hypothetical protein n=1 Tax=Micromonospora echinospora TaxID=1877 RepID=UPI003A8354FC
MRVEVLTSQPADEAPWHWEDHMRLTSPSGVLVLDSDLVKLPDPPRIELGTRPGVYGLAVGHVGRTEVQDAARRVSEETSHASAEETRAAWRSLDGIERYLIRLWPLDEGAV